MGQGESASGCMQRRDMAVNRWDFAQVVRECTVGRNATGQGGRTCETAAALFVGAALACETFRPPLSRPTQPIRAPE